MIDDLKPYPAYKDSGMPWLGQVPEHWEVQRIKTLFRETDERNGNGGGLLLSLTRTRGIVPQSEASNRIASVEDLSNYKVCKSGDLVMNRMQAWSGMFAVSGMDGVISPDYSVFQPKVAIEVHYFEALFKTPVLVDEFAKRSKGIGSGFNRLYTPDFGAIPIASPPLNEQTAIVRFLDYMDRRIRRYVRAKQKLIKLLEEYKQALIHQAVTGSIDVRTGKPYPAYKDSGVEWLGEVPEHWELKPLKRWVRINASVLPDTTPADYEFRYIDIGTVGTGFLTREPQQLRFSNAPSRARRVLHMGDTLVSTVRTYLKAVYYVDGDAEALVCSTGFAVLTPGPGTQPKYVSYLVQSNTFTDRVTAESVGTAYPAIAEGRLGSFYVPFPPLPEQNAIVEYLDTQTAKIDAAISAARSEIELLREYRTRLIADVVTGKVDVREVAARLPEELSEEEAESMDADEIAEDEATDEEAGTETVEEEEVEP